MQQSDALRRLGLSWRDVMLAVVPVAIVLWLIEAPAIWRFLVAAAAILPLAGLMGEATEQLAHRLGPGIGGLLNATFGNAAELIIALFALFRGLDGVVKASLTGSIIGNLLLVMGASLLAGGLRFSVQQFNRTAAGVGATMMVLASTGLLIPAIFHELVDPRRDLPLEHELSIGVAVALFVTYLLSLVFSLRTHKALYNPKGQDTETEAPHRPWSMRRALVTLLAATALVALVSEVLIGAVDQASHTMGLTEVFIGVIVVAIVGNAAEHSTAILVARKNQMDLSMGIAVGSAQQIALFVAPVLVFASYLRDHPLDLLFTPLEVVAVVLAVLIARMVAEDGESNWLEGVMLLMLYVILGLAFFFLPEHAAGTPGAPVPEIPAAISAPG